MPAKAKLAAPIDRPLSRAYLRQFKGWSTAYPPGLSDPTSLREMENVYVLRDGAVAVRPGMRYLSYMDGDSPIDVKPVGTHEAFFLNDGRKAYLFAVREEDETVGFRVAIHDENDAAIPYQVVPLTEPGVDFTFFPSEAALAFTAATTYVKYLQIDNKIFALSNAGETMRYFTVGETKTAKVLTSIERPDWNVADKLEVMHPEAAWINSALPINARYNRASHGSMESSGGWIPGSSQSTYESSSTVAQGGTYSMRVSSVEVSRNRMPAPLNDVVANGHSGWSAQANVTSLTDEAGGLRAFVTRNTEGTVRGGLVDVQPGANYQLSLDLASSNDIASWKAEFRFYDAFDRLLLTEQRNMSLGAGRKNTSAVQAPFRANTMRVYILPTANNSAGSHHITFKNVLVNYSHESTAFYDGDSGAGYFWAGATNASESIQHPAATIGYVLSVNPIHVDNWIASLYARAGSAARNVTLSIYWYNSANVLLGSVSDTPAPDASGSWTRFDVTGLAPAGTTQAEIGVTIDSVPRGEFHYLDSVLFEEGTTLDPYFDGSTPDVGSLQYTWAGAPNASWSIEAEYTAPSATPTPETPAAGTLIDSTPATNDNNVAFFYTISNDIGESAASQVTVVRVARPWTSWRWETPNGTGAPSGTTTSDPGLAADQLVAVMPEDVFDAAIAQGAIAWNLYMYTWSDEAAAPTSAIQVGRQALNPLSSYDAYGWQRLTPQTIIDQDIALIPSERNRYNYSKPSRGGNGIVAGDRMVLVNDPTQAAVIRWTSSRQGQYTNFTAAKGGGYKTLTSGNLFLTGSVKLWQNPQSVDTLTVLCMGVDAYSTGYYMSPADVSQQSESTSVMGFEETTATPGSTSPYGAEVFNNALYHPLDDQLMKSSAQNYNISHKSLTDEISNQWTNLFHKEKIVSCVHDNRIYYIVHNADGEPLLDGCFGNEIWVYDSQAKEGSWARWLIQATSLRRIEVFGTAYLSVVRPDGIYYLDPLFAYDHYVVGGDIDMEDPSKPGPGDDPETAVIGTVPIQWRLETNTQGANRAHDAWCRLQQANVIFGSFVGSCEYGVRGLDVHGKYVEKVKTFIGDAVPSDTELLTRYPFDREDFMLIQRDMRDWFFFARSHTVDDEVEPSAGQINLVQYRYAPVSVNVGYEYGSIETFEYGRDSVRAASTATVNGVPDAYIDTSRP